MGTLWKVKDYRNSGLGVCQANDENEVICWMAGTKTKMSRDRVSEAHIIAAAPKTAAERDRLKALNADLLDVVKGLVGDIDEKMNAYYECGLDPFFDLKRAQDAISKAEGGD